MFKYESNETSAWKQSKPDSLPNAGLNVQTAQKVAEILYNISDVTAVTITDTERVLAYIGIECQKHPTVGMPIVTAAAREVLRSGALMVVHNRSGFCCDNTEYECPIESTVIAPLTLRDKIIGTVKLYRPEKDSIPSYVLKLAVGAAQLLSMQIELAEKDHLEQLMIQAQLDALQAKINPHFLFNTLNTISMLIRTDPEKARELLLNFSAYFRNALRSSGNMITLEQELENVKNYLVLEKARFGDKLTIETFVERELLENVIPMLCIQPLVENAIIHGISPKEGNGKVRISVTHCGTDMIEVSVSDDGVGIQSGILPKIKEQGFSSGTGAASGHGVGLYNVDQRLRILCGEASALVVKSSPGEGTKVSFTVKRRVGDNGDTSLCY